LGIIVAILSGAGLVFNLCIVCALLVSIKCRCMRRSSPTALLIGQSLPNFGWCLSCCLSQEEWDRAPLLGEKARSCRAVGISPSDGPDAGVQEAAGGERGQPSGAKEDDAALQQVVAAKQEASVTAFKALWCLLCSLGLVVWAWSTAVFEDGGCGHPLVGNASAGVSY
jgi:hypothetical protein